MPTEPTPAELNESAMNFYHRGDGIMAAKQLQWALIKDPMYAEAWHNRAQVLRTMNDPFDAVLCVRKALEIEPYNAAFLNTLGVCYSAMSQYGDAIYWFRQSLKSDPNLAAAHNNLAYALNAVPDYDRAVYHARRYSELMPDNGDAHMLYAMALLRDGQLGYGFEEYKWRDRATGASRRMKPLPDWDGFAPVQGVVIFAEQGYGDTIQFMRFVPQLKRKYPDMRVYLEVKKPMVGLAETIYPVDGIVKYGSPWPRDATHGMAIMTLPCALRIKTEDDLEGCVPYLHPPKVTFDSILPEALNVGICWRTGVRPYQPELSEFADLKSIHESFLAPLAHIEGVRWHSLQVPKPEKLPFPMMEYELHDFMDTAQLIKNLDVVVSVDTSVAHLAGALGAKTCLLTPFDNCWRWRGDHSFSVWYPTILQYRQSAPGDWPSVIKRVKDDIEWLVTKLASDD